MRTPPSVPGRLPGGDPSAAQAEQPRSLPTRIARHAELGCYLAVGALAVPDGIEGGLGRFVPRMTFDPRLAFGLGLAAVPIGYGAEASAEAERELRVAPAEMVTRPSGIRARLTRLSWPTRGVGALSVASYAVSGVLGMADLAALRHGVPVTALPYKEIEPMLLYQASLGPGAWSAWRAARETRGLPAVLPGPTARERFALLPRRMQAAVVGAWADLGVAMFASGTVAVQQAGGTLAPHVTGGPAAIPTAIVTTLLAIPWVKAATRIMMRRPAQEN